MTKSELARELAVSEKLHLSTAVKAVDGIIRIIKEEVAKGNDVTLRGFGTIAPVERAARQARHFKSGEEITMPAHRTVVLRVSNELKTAVNNGNVG